MCFNLLSNAKMSLQLIWSFQFRGAGCTLYSERFKWLAAETIISRSHVCSLLYCGLFANRLSMMNAIILGCNTFYFIIFTMWMKDRVKVSSGLSSRLRAKVWMLSALVTWPLARLLRYRVISIGKKTDWCFTARQHKLGQFMPIYQGDYWLRRLRIAYNNIQCCMRYSEHTHATANNRYALLA